MKKKLVLLRLSALILVAAIGVSIYQLNRINGVYAKEAAVHEHMQQYRPVLQALPVAGNAAAETIDNTTPIADDSNDTEPALLNQNIVDLQANYEDALGWLTIPNTLIDYPFVQGSDNEHYLHSDMEQNRSSAGTLFVDHRNSMNFTDFNTIIFGHNMRNGSMFGTLKSFNDSEFFESNESGLLYLRDKTYEVEVFAFAVIKHNDGIVYNPDISTEAEKVEFLDYLRDNARYYRDIDVTTDDHFVVMSTCSYEFNNARMVVVGRLSV